MAALFKSGRSDHLDSESGTVRYNYHAHAIFLNYDFKRKVTPLGNLQRTDFSKQQDYLAKVMKGAGFRRGRGKSETAAEHRDKTEYVAHKLKKF